MIGAMKRKASLSFSEGISINNNNNNNNNLNGTVITAGGAASAASNGPKPEKRIRWDGPRTQSLIEHYRGHEYLWNPKLADYKNDKKRTQCLELWLEQNHFDRDLVNEVKMKLHGLRTSFGHQLKLEYASASEPERGRGVGEECGPFVSKWQWYNQLSFLKETMTFRTASSNNNSQSPVDSPPAALDHGHLSAQMSHHEEPENVKMEISSNNAPLNMQVMSHYSVQQHPENHGDYVMQTHQTHHHGHSQPHNLTVSGVPISVHDPHQTIISHSRKEEEEPMSYHHVRITATPPMAHMQSITSQQPTIAHSSQPDLPRFQSASSGGCCSCNCTDRPRLSIAEKLGRLVEETMNNLHPEYQEMTRIEIQQVLGKYLQKPIP